MPKVSDAHRERVREQILDAAIGCFAERGIRPTTMADIIAASGLSAGAIYGYFDSKQELALAAMRRTIAGRAADVDDEAANGALSPAQILRALSEGYPMNGVPPALVVQLWGEAMSDDDFRAVANVAFGEISGVFIVHLTRWGQVVRGMSETDAAEWATRMIPVLLALAQGFILQREVLAHFDRSAYLAGVDELFGAAG